jgi:hypothetical protein
MGNLSIVLPAVEKEGECARGGANSLSKKVKDLQFGHEHFNLFECEEALLHFCSVNL